ncbi:MAG: lysylphosphatidylglycerol synthase transmembrane domain-containing protein [Promethearchaeota archaeon]|jgi:uncharacterized protein (TIRG00374 family)
MTENDKSKILEWLKKWKRPLIGLATICLIIIMLYLVGVDLPRLIQKITTIGIWGLVLFIFIYTFAFILRAYKLKLIFKGLDRNISYSTSYFSIGASFLINDSTPGKLGDIAKIFIIRDQEGIKLSESVAGIAIERILDLILLFIISSFALVYLYLGNFNSIGILGQNIQFYLIIGAIFIILILGLIFLTIYKTDFVINISKKISPKIADYLERFITNFKKGIQKYKDHKKEFIFIVLLGFPTWFADAFIVIIFFYLSGYQLNMILLMLAIILSFFSKIFPISPGGWGISENVGALFIFFFYPAFLGGYSEILSIFIIDHLFRSGYLLFFGGYSILHYNLSLRELETMKIQ